MKTRKKREPPKKKKNGGRRAGAGRKAFGEEPMNNGVYIRCTSEQKQALLTFVKGLSQKREENGQSKVTLSTWLRELGLKYSGNEDLGVARFGGIIE